MDFDIETILEVLMDEADEKDPPTIDGDTITWSRSIGDQSKRNIVLQFRATEQGVHLYFEPGIQAAELPQKHKERWFTFALNQNRNTSWKPWGYNGTEIRYEQTLFATPENLLQQIDRALDEASELLRLIYGE